MKFLILVLTPFLLTGCQNLVRKEMTLGEARYNYEQGNDQRAFRLSEALAFEGDKDAQYAVGYMYFYGVGVPKDQQLGVLWIKRAADKGQSKAIAALKQLRQARVANKSSLIPYGS